jgi:N utilization substance protein A
MSNFEIVEALGQIAREKSIDMGLVLETLKAGLLLAAKKMYGTSENIGVEVNQKNGQVEMFALKRVVEEVQRPNLEISLEEARRIDRGVELDGEVKVELSLSDFGRNAILAAKQVLMQRIREAERDKIYEDYQSRVGEIVTGTVQQLDRGTIVVNLGRSEGVIPPSEQIKKERYRQGDTIRSYVLQVEKTNKGPQIKLSRTVPGFLVKLFELEVPEIYEKIVEIKAVAREPGSRSKIAVVSADARIDPVGACVGVKGSRVQNVVRELGNERIDIINWSPASETFVNNALSPAKILHTDVYPQENRVRVVVDDDQLSLAIGKSGQNARLAAKLTGWKIDIFSQTRYKQLLERERLSATEVGQLPGVGPKLAEKLKSEGIENLLDLRNRRIEELTDIPGIGLKRAESLLAQVEEIVER